MGAQRDDAPATVSIVGEEAALRRSIVLLLRAAGYRPQAHSTCDALLASAARSRRRPRCILIDHRMPDGMDGIDCLRRLAAAGIAVPSILIVDAERPLLDDAIASHVVAVLPKPVVRNEIVTAVAEATAPRDGATRQHRA